MFEPINQFLGAAGLRNPTLDVLNQDGALYNTLLFQPREGIAWGADFVRIANRERGIQKFRSFFDLASERNVELAITPEYSCPWEVITELIDNGTLPEENKIWILGCESIKAQALHDLMAAHNEITWITENQRIAANLHNDHFFNPVCYVFRTRSEADNGLRTVIIVQFKTQPLGGAALEWERDNFIQGGRIYIIQNIANSSRLVTLICSDILNPVVRVDQLPDFMNIPYLVVHIQLNPAPNHLNFSRYRGDTYGMGRENKEFICLNWSRNISLGDINPWSHYGGSALYIKPDNDKHLNVSDERINHNHSHGLYYTRWADRYANIYFFNFDEYVFLLRTTKPSQLAVAPPLRRRSGPEMTAAFHWKNNNWESADSVDSDFANSCAALHAIGTYANLREIYNESPINAERLVSLSIGKAVHDSWHEPTSNFFFKVKDNEINERVTFAQNPCADTQARRKYYLLNYGTLEYSIIINQAYIPDSIADLRGNCRIGYRDGGYATNFNLNLYPQNDAAVPATGLFIGNSTREDALDTLSKITALFKGDQFGKRVVVWYSDHNGHIQNEYCDSPPKITDDTTKSTRSIRRTKIKKTGQA